MCEGSGQVGEEREMECEAMASFLCEARASNLQDWPNRQETEGLQCCSRKVKRLQSDQI